AGAARRLPEKSSSGGSAFLANRGAPPPFAAVVRGGLQLLCRTTDRSTIEDALDGDQQLALIALERQDIVALSFQDRLGNRTAVKQRIADHRAVLELQHLENFQGFFDLVASGRLARCQGKPRFGSEDVDQMHRRGALAAIVGTAQRLAVDSDDAFEVELAEPCKGSNELEEYPFESHRVEQAKHSAESIVPGHPTPPAQGHTTQGLIRM